MESAILLCRMEYAVREEIIGVCLYAYQAGIAFEYSLELVQGGDRMTSFVGQDLEAARMLLYRLALGGVTACHFRDVVGDDLFAVL